VTVEVLTASVMIAAPPAAIFPYLTESELLVQWLGDWAEVNPMPGGTFAVDMNKVAVRGAYVEVEPPHRVVFTWGVPGRDGLGPGSTTVEVVLTEEAAGTRVDLFHHGLPSSEVASHRHGWVAKLESMRSCVVNA
jgi:uncharacterized protein YndB with AHSA1/START domain